MYYYLLLTTFLGFLYMDKLAHGQNSTKKDAISMRMTSVLEPRSNSSRTELRINTDTAAVIKPGTLCFLPAIHTTHDIQANTLTPRTSWVNEDSCGKTDKTLSSLFPRIVGGSKTERGEYPWMAMLLNYYTESHQFIFLCGGSLIKKQWVLTAGHCFTNAPISYTHVALGAHRKDLKDPSVKRFAIANYVCHHLFMGAHNAYKDDICLVKLAGEVEYNEYIKPICLPSTSQEVRPGESCQIAGWGETKGTGDNTLLQKASVFVIKKSQCSSWYETSFVTLPEYHFCAGRTLGAVDSCQGDSGGPLTCSRTVSNSASKVLFGITSFGIGCAEKHRPGVYTEVSNYIGWIEKQIGYFSGKEECYSESGLLKCGTTITKSGTILRTPVVDTATWLYPPNVECSWDIEAPVGCEIRLTFECFFHVEINPANTDECYDYMKIVSEGADINSIYCGSDLLNPVAIKSSKATISFHSDASIQSSGFVIIIDFIGSPILQPDPKAGKLQTDMPTNPVNVAGREDGTTQDNAVSEGGGTTGSDAATQPYSIVETTRSVTDCTGKYSKTTSKGVIIKPAILPIIGSSFLVFKFV